MRLACYAHPFDLTALATMGGLSRLADLGFAEVVLATSYHDGRWLTPWHPTKRVRFLEDGTVHFRPRADYGLLQPLVSSEVPTTGPSPLEHFTVEARHAGVDLRAWTVGTHNSRLGGRHPDVCVQNAFGDIYTYALCPAQPRVQQYLEAIVQDLAAHQGVTTIEFEAYGQMGWKHSSHHDKASLAPAGVLEAALSACFCTACKQAHQAAGVDAESLQHEVAAFLAQHVQHADAMAPAALPTAAPPWLNIVLSCRRDTVRRTTARLVGASGSVARAVQVHPNHWFTGSQLAASTAVCFPAGDERVLTCYGDGPDAIRKLLTSADGKTLASSPRRLCLWPKAPQFTSDEDLRHTLTLCEELGITSIGIYHLGLLPWRTIERVAKMLR